MKKDNIHELQNLISEVSYAVVAEFEIKILFDKIVAVTKEGLNADACSIYMRTLENPNEIDIEAADGYHKKIEQGNKYQINGKGLTAHVVSKGKSYNLNLKELEDLRKKGIAKRQADEMQWGEKNSPQFRNLIAVPIRIKNDILGVIKVENKQPIEQDKFSDEDLEALKIIGNLTATAYENARLHEQKEDELRQVASKAAHKLGNQVALFEGVLYDLRKAANNESIELNKKLNPIEDQISNTYEDLKRIVRDFIRYSKPTIVSRELSNLNQLIDENLNYWKSSYRNIQITKKLSSSIKDFYFDKKIIINNIHELVRNSSRAMGKEETKSIIIITDVISDDKDIDQIVILVENFNSHISQNFIKKLFIPFQSNTNGTGLGLANAKKEIGAHEGNIELDYNKNNVVRFKITIPYLKQLN